MDGPLELGLKDELMQMEHEHTWEGMTVRGTCGSAAQRQGDG